MAHTVKEGKRGFIRFTMTFSAEWTDEDVDGQPVTSDDIDDAFFHVKKNDRDEVAILEKSLNLGGIIWEDEDAGIILVEFNEETLGKAGNYRFELSIKLTNGDYASVQIGDLIIQKSVTGNPA